MDKNDGGKLAVVTGAGGGLAPAVVRRFAAAGYRLALITRPGKEAAAEALLAEARTALGCDVAGARYGIDLALPEGTREALGRLQAEMGPVDALLNLAGGFARGPADRAEPARFERMLDINLRTAVNATAALLPGMLERGSGFVAAMSANAVLSPAPGSTDYAAAKGAVATYFRSLAAEVGKVGVNVALVIPTAAIDTPANRAQMPNADPANWLDPEALAEVLLFLATRPARGRVHELVVSPR